MDYKGRLVELPQNRVWRSYQGGRILDELVGKEEPRDSHYPEDWVASVTAARNPGARDEREGISTVRLDGQSVLFTDLIATDPEYFLGKHHVARFGQQPMVLVKLLDSAVRLQLQVHPTAEFAQTHLGTRSGKAEAYYILGVREGVDEAFLYMGFQRPPSRAELKRNIEAQDTQALESYFDKILVEPGDVLFIPGGIPHAIGPGIFMVEIQEPSDLVVRFEFEIAGYTLPEPDCFMNRGLEFCLDIIDFEPKPASLVRSEYLLKPRPEATCGANAHRYYLVGADTTPCFQVKKAVINGRVDRQDHTSYIGIVTAGSCIVRTDKAVTRLGTFDKFFCPAGLGKYTIEADEEVQILECLPPA